MATDKPYCRGIKAIFRKLPDNGAECVIDFRDESLLSSVLFHLNGEYHESQMFVRESNELLRERLAEPLTHRDHWLTQLASVADPDCGCWTLEQSDAVLEIIEWLKKLPTPNPTSREALAPNWRR